MFKYFKLFLEERVPILLLSLYPTLCELPEEIPYVLSFLFNSNLRKTTLFQRFYLIVRCYFISLCIDCPHKQSEILRIISSIISIPPCVRGCVVEAGSYKGGSTTKFSLACKITGRQLVVFDSFEGMPENNQLHEVDEHFAKGSYCGSLDEVKNNIDRFGYIDVCKFIKGWFENTMPNFSEKVVVIHLDVDLPSSTRTCLKFLYPLLVEGGILFSHDGHLPAVVNVYDNNLFWHNAVNSQKPYIKGLRKQKLIKIIKR